MPEIKHKRLSRLLPAAVFSILLILLFRAAGPFVYSNNDDLYRKMIVSGEISGSPSPYLIYGHFLLGGLLSGLYRIFPSVPWYGLFSCGCVSLAMCAVLYRLLGRCRSLPAKLAAGVVFSLFTPFLFYRHLALLQYTVLAGIVGGSAVFWALTMELQSRPHRGETASCAVLCLLAILTYCIRDQVFFMLLPFAGVLWLGRFLCDPGSMSVQKCLRYFRPMGALLLLLAVFIGIQKAAYASPEWKDFLSFVDSSVTLYDYNGFPEYEENRELYEALNISPLSREAMSSRYLVLTNPDAAADKFAELAQRSRELSSSPFTLPRAASLWVQSLSTYTDRAMRPVNLLILLLYAAFLILAALKGSLKALLQPVLLFLTRSLMWIYILLQGRCPERISWTLLLVELFCLSGLALSLWNAPGKALRGSLTRSFVTVLSLCGLALCLRSRGVLTETAQRAASTLAFSENYEELKTYCNSRPTEHFLLDLYAAAYYTEDMLSFDTAKNENTLSLGSWLTGSPLTDARLASWGIEEAGTAVLDDPGLYVIFADSPDFPPDYFFRYYEEKYPGCSFTLEDTLKGSQGISFLIYKGRR